MLTRRGPRRALIKQNTDRVVTKWTITQSHIEKKKNKQTNHIQQGSVHTQMSVCTSQPNKVLSLRILQFLRSLPLPHLFQLNFHNHTRPGCSHPVQSPLVAASLVFNLRKRKRLSMAQTSHPETTYAGFEHCCSQEYPRTLQATNHTFAHSSTPTTVSRNVNHHSISLKIKQSVLPRCTPLDETHLRGTVTK